MHYPIYADNIKLTRKVRQGKQGGTGLSVQTLIHTSFPVQFKTAHIQVAIYPIYAAYASSEQNRDTKGELVQKLDNNTGIK